MTASSSDPREIRWRRASWALFAIAFVVALIFFRDWGITWDEEGQNSYGGQMAR